MQIIGLTGGIAMGKSTVAAIFERRGIAVCSADAIVHQLLGVGGAAVASVAALVPESLEGGAINRQVLGRKVFAHPELRKKLEAIIHPLVASEEAAFALREQIRGAARCVLEIPLLYEVGAERRCDKVVVVSCAPEIQQQRVLARAGMTQEKFSQILAAQLPDEDRRLRADFVIDTGASLSEVEQQVDQIMEQLGA